MMPNNLDPSAVGASFNLGDPLSSMYVNRLAAQQSATASAPNLFGGQAQQTPSYSDSQQGQSAATGYTQGANAGAGAGATTGASPTSSLYGEQGARNALTEQEDSTHQLFSRVYEQVGEDVNQ